MATKQKTAAPVQKLDPRTPSQIALGVINDTVDEWKKENTPEKIKASAVRILEANSKEIITKLLGFDDRWGKFELDHCNGRAGNSAAGSYFAEQQKIAVKKWLSQVDLPVLTASEKKSVLASIREDYYRAYASQLRDLALTAARAEAEKAFTELSATSLLEKIDKTEQLLNM